MPYKVRPFGEASGPPNYMLATFDLVDGAVYQLEQVRMKTKAPSIEAVMRQAIYRLAHKHGVAVPSEDSMPSDEDAAARGHLDHGNVVSLMTHKDPSVHGNRRFKFVLPATPGGPNWLRELCEKTGQTEVRLMLLDALRQYVQENQS